MAVGVQDAVKKSHWCVEELDFFGPDGQELTTQAGPCANAMYDLLMVDKICTKGEVNSGGPNWPVQY